MKSRKSHSWWWASHVSPKCSKWLVEDFEEMDQRVKRMLKLIEEDADSFAKKAEMYYQKRPELICHVEEFYRMYRSLAERYDHVTGELRRNNNIPSDLQSQGSSVSDVISSDLPSTCPSPDQKPSRRKSAGPRAAGFDFFLGSAAGGAEFYQKEGDESSSLSDSETESDCSSGFGGNAGDQGVQRKIIELEIELREAREKLRLQEERHLDGCVRNENTEALLARIAGYGQELRLANEKIQLSNEENSRLKIELQKYNASLEGELPIIKTEKTELEDRLRCEIERFRASIAERDDHIQNLYGSLDSLESERDMLKSEVVSRDDRIDQMEKHNEDLEEEIEKQRVMISEGAEEKREAIRQLCFSLEHYRSGYISLRKAFTGHKRVEVFSKGCGLMV